MDTSTLIKAYHVSVRLSITNDEVLVLAYSLGQLDMFLKAHYGEKAFEVTEITLKDGFDLILTPELG